MGLSQSRFREGDQHTALRPRSIEKSIWKTNFQCLMRDEVHFVMRQLPNVRQTCTPGERKQNIKALAALAFLLALETKVVDAE